MTKLVRTLAGLADRPKVPGRTLRMRLTLVYGGLFLLSGAALLAITYLLVVQNTRGFVFTTEIHGHHAAIGSVDFGSGPKHPAGSTKPTTSGKTKPTAATRLASEAAAQHASELHELLLNSGIALAAMSLVSILLGWIVAGRVLRPLRTITATAREISASNLHERLALSGPDDELKELGDTIDQLLARLDGSFQAQRRFVANASHELRTPLALTRAMLEFALADPELTLVSLRSTCDEVLVTGAKQEQLIEALLTLARSQQGLECRKSFGLDLVTDKALLDGALELDRFAVTVQTSIQPAPAEGDMRLAERLVANLLSNAVRYNVPGGRVDVVTGLRAERPFVSVTNTGPVIPPDEVDRLLRPFQRLGDDSTYHREDDGVGLGLSIVQAIAGAHHARLDIEAPPAGGLVVTVTFPTLERHKPAKPPVPSAGSARRASGTVKLVRSIHSRVQEIRDDN